MMAINRYRLKHLEQQQHRGAQRTARLLRHPDRLITLILLGNNVANFTAVWFASMIGLRLLGEAGQPTFILLLSIFTVVFAELLPKTLAALHPERFALTSAHILTPLMHLLRGLVRLLNSTTIGILALFGGPRDKNAPGGANSLSHEELRIVVREAGSIISARHRDMLLRILDLERLGIEEVMVPRKEIQALDLELPTDELVESIRSSTHSRLPVYNGELDRIEGVLRISKVLRLLSSGEEIDDARLRSLVEEAYFIPESTPMLHQLLNFQQHRKQFGLVVDEYGALLGLITLEDILEEVVGEFGGGLPTQTETTQLRHDGSYLVDGSSNVRELNQQLNWQLPTGEARTVNGLILERLEQIPEPGISLLIGNYMFEVIQTSGNAVKKTRILCMENKTQTPPHQSHRTKRHKRKRTPNLALLTRRFPPRRGGSLPGVSRLIPTPPHADAPAPHTTNHARWCQRRRPPLPPAVAPPTIPPNPPPPPGLPGQPLTCPWKAAPTATCADR